MHIFFGDLVLPRQSQILEPALARLQRQDDILAYGQIIEDAGGLAVFRRERQPAVDRTVRGEL